MNTAVATTAECTFLDQLELEPEVTFQETLRELCGLFISVSDSRIYLIHQTARQFLLAREAEKQLVSRATGAWMHSMDYQTSHFELARLSLLYLHFSDYQFQSRVTASQDAINEEHQPPDSGQRQAFRTYSANYWYYHVSESGSADDASLMKSMLSITSPGSQAFKTWMASLPCY